MYIKQLKLKNYRNYENLDIEFDNKVNVIIGENAQGKTNLLESIYLLAFTKSYRTSNDRELISWNKDFAKISGSIHKRNQDIPLELIFNKNGKKAKLNRLEQKRLSEYIGALNVVMFAPEDLSLVKGPPQVRRRFIDMELGQIEPVYIYHLAQYLKVLKQRNHLLKQLQLQAKPDTTLLHVLNDQFIQHAAIILKKRFVFLKLLRKWAIPIHFQISREQEELKIAYSSSLEVLEDDDEEKLEDKYYAALEQIERNEIKACDAEITAFIILKLYIALIFDWEKKRKPLSEKDIAHLFDLYIFQGLSE